MAGDLTFLFIGLAVGAAATIPAVLAYARKGSTAQEAELGALNQERNSLREEKSRLEIALGEERARLQEQHTIAARASATEEATRSLLDTTRAERDASVSEAASLRRDIEDLRVKVAKLDENLASREAQIASLEQVIANAKESMDKSFNEASTKALQEATGKFLELATGQFKEEQHRSTRRAEEEAKAIERLLDPMAKELEALEKLTRETDEKRSETFGQLKGQIESLSKNSESLANALKKPSVRGSWGEGQLISILES